MSGKAISMALRCFWYRSGHARARYLQTGVFTKTVWFYTATNKATAATSTQAVRAVDVRNTHSGPKGASLRQDGHPNLDLTFSDCKEAYRSKTTGQLLSAYLVFQICSVPVIVNHSSTLMKRCRSIFGEKIFKKIMQKTFYGHFVAGEDCVAIQPVVHRNQKFGVKSILSFSAEEEVPLEMAKTPNEKAVRQEQIVEDAEHHQLKEKEELFDKNMEIFLSSIDGVAEATKKSGFCAVKVASLCRPELLIQMSDVLVSARNFFKQLTSLERENSCQGFREDEFLLRLQKLGVKVTPEECSKLFSVLDLNEDGIVDIMDWDNLLEVNMRLGQQLVVSDPKTGTQVPLILSLSLQGENEMKNLLRRVNKIAEYAVERDVRVMIDAEQTFFQPAINRLSMELIKKFNTEKPIIFNTYQCYLKSAHENLKLDLDTAMRHNVYFGAKLVRGAYMEQERERAAFFGYEDPINPTFEATTAMYYKVLGEVMLQIQMSEKGRIAVMVASHNEDTVRYTVEKMKEFGIKPEDNVIYFGQLLGMCDQMSFPLGQVGYSVYKYVPYGPVEEVMPYLSRRAQENRGVFTKVKKEKRLLRSEILRRLRRGQLRYDPLKNLPDN